ncbi:Bardet-Biedl syndrome 2 protein homolog [Ixodes scapularis]
MAAYKGRESLEPVFTFHLNQKIQPRKVTVGKYDGLHACLTAATASDKNQCRCAWAEEDAENASWIRGLPGSVVDQVHPTEKMAAYKGRESLEPVFTFHLNQKIQPRKVTVGKYDGLHACLTAATASDKVLVHNPRGPSGPTGESSGVSLLSLSQAVHCLVAGSLRPGAKEDVLLVGTATALLAYDVENNADLFFREVPDGANCITTGYLGTLRNPVVLVGGNCSIQGYDHEGKDVFWTVTGDNVRALALYDYLKDGLNELLVGSEDFDIRIFKEDIIVSEITETEAITALCPITEDCFAYALSNGTIGVYKGTDRIWRIKSKNHVTCLHGYDIDGDGVPELITGWSNGKVDGRHVTTGEVVFRDAFPHGVAGIVQADYCGDGREELIVCSVNGEVRGYLPTTAELRQQIVDATFEQDTVRELSQKKQAATQLKTLLAINSGTADISPHVEVALKTNNETVIHAVMLFAEGIFSGESFVQKGCSQVLVHNPRGPSGPTGESSGVSLLSLSQAVHCLVAGSLRPGAKEDVLLVGTATALLAYDVENNADLFFREVPDGANCITTGYLGTLRNPVVLVGGNCSIQGYDHEGKDVFWTVTGDNVRALALYDYLKDGLNELLVGSEDFDIRIFKEDIIVSEITETEAITALCPITEDCFAYALSNGTIGVYKGTDRIWRIKSKNHVTCLHGYDIDGDGVPELITGWSNGKVDGRHVTTGEVVFRDAFPHGVAGIVQADYCGDGREELIVCSVNGEVRGYLPTTAELRQQIVDATFEQDTVRELSQKKQMLQLEMRNYEGQAKTASGTPKGTTDQRYGTISGPHILQTELCFECGTPCLCKKFTGKTQQSKHFHVFEVSRQLPKFAMYLLVDEARTKTPTGSVRFKLAERPQRVASWVNQNFLLPEDLCPDDRFNVTFVSLRELKPITIRVELNGEVTIETDMMEVAAEMVQSLAAFLSLQELESTAHFPEDNANLQLLMSKVQEHLSARLTISANMADTATIVRDLVLRAEDSRLMGDFKSMRNWYQELQALNRELISGYKIRCHSHEELMACLRQLNQGIQRGARLRVGRFKSRVVLCARAAVKAADAGGLVRAISTGEP